MRNSHDALASEANVLDEAAELANVAPHRAVASLDGVHRFLTERFLPHARLDEQQCARLALRDHRHPEGRCGEPEVEALTQRLEHVREAIEREGETLGMTEILRTLLGELRPLVHAHVAGAETAAGTRPSGSRRERQG